MLRVTTGKAAPAPVPVPDIALVLSSWSSVGWSLARQHASLISATRPKQGD